MVFTQSVRNRFAQTSKLTYLVVFVALWLGAALFAWFHVVYESPEHVFKGMLKNNFSTVGYAKSATSSQGTLTSEETSQLQLGGQGLLQSVTTLTQGNDKVTTATITTAEKQYVSYTNIKTDRTDKSGKPLRFDKVLGVWAASDSQNIGGGANQAVSQMMLGLIPIGNVSPKNRQEILTFIDQSKAITANYNTVKKKHKDGRLLYVYEVKIQPVPYLQMLKKYGQAAGLGEQVASLNPNDYKNTPATTVQVVVDARAQHLVALASPGQAETGELYSGFGIQKHVKLPAKTISTDELQQRLNVQ